MQQKIITILITILYITLPLPSFASIWAYQYSSNTNYTQNIEKTIYLENKYCINTHCSHLKKAIKKEIETKENKFANVIKKTTKEISGLLYIPLLPLSVAVVPIMFITSWSVAIFTVNTIEEAPISK